MNHYFFKSHFKRNRISPIKILRKKRNPNLKQWIFICIIFLIILLIKFNLYSYKSITNNRNDRLKEFNFYNFRTQKKEEELDSINKYKRCEFPKMRPFGKEINSLLRKPAELNCISEFNSSSGRIFNVERGTRILNKVSKMYDPCCYKPYYRTSDHYYGNKFDMKTCFPINNEQTELPPEHDMFEVFCSGKRMDGFAIVAEKPELEALLQSKNITNKGTDKLNIIILGIDATSRMNFLRMMPNSNSYLIQNLSAIALKGYTKVAENTLPNLIPIFTGLTLEEFKTNCINKDTLPDFVRLDACPFIWKNFSAQGYRTSYAEDYAKINMFNMQWPYAFDKPPTDYYLRTFISFMEFSQSSADEQCLGTRYSFKVLLDNIEHTAVAFKKQFNQTNEKPYFQFTWTSRLAHDDFNYLSLGDQPLKNTLEYLNLNGHLNNTLLMLISDHGARMGDINNDKTRKVGR